MSGQRSLTQPQRLLALVIDAAIVAAACWYLFGTIYPPVGNTGFWAYSALLAVLVGTKLVTPFYVKPADAIAYAVPAFISIMLVNAWESWTFNQHLGFVLASGLPALIFLLGVGNIVANALDGKRAHAISDLLRTILDVIARPQFIYTPLILFAVFCFHTESWNEAVTILIVTILTVVTSAGDFIVLFGRRVLELGQKGDLAGSVEVFAFQDPGIVLLRKQRDGDVKKSDVLVVADKNGPRRVVVALDNVGRSDGILVRTVELRSLSQAGQEIVGPLPLEQRAYPLKNATLASVLDAEGLSPGVQSSIVGLVAPDTSVERLYFEVVNDADLRTGRLVSAHVGGHKVLYQIAAGLTREEIVQQKNTYGFVRGQAQQIGIWDEQAGKFAPCGWVPSLNAPVYLEETAEYEIAADSIGRFPGTNLHTRIKSTADLVTHNTAILGILGIGKSCLAFELVERLLADKIKVICLDLTDEYREKLSEFCHEFTGDDLYDDLVGETGADGKKKFSKNVEEGGSKPSFRVKLDAFIDRFITTDLDRNLLVVNPSHYEVWRQASPWFREDPGMTSLTATEITQLFTEAALKACQKRGRVEKGVARVCLVFEEAHSLVPEWNAVVNDGDKAAVNGTARAILQGRKFGLGCLLVTQRTANVTKTILNQCNTIFAMRTFDETGKEFLSNYIGRDYTDTLSSIPERHAVFFGKASSCENPVLIRLNDTEAFRPEFRLRHPPPAPESIAVVEPKAAVTGAAAAGNDNDSDDKIPF